MPTTISLRDLGISPGQATRADLDLELPPYAQAGVEYAMAAPTIPARLDITAMTEGTSFRLRFDAAFTGPCARCLEPATYAVTIDAHAVHDHDTTDEDLRCDHVDDATLLLDVSSWAREEVGLQFPTRVLCRRACRGLCAQCGVNLNDHPDHAHEAPVDSRWDALRALQLDDGAATDGQ